MDTPIPPFRNIPRASLFRVLATERDPEEMSLKHVGETGYAVSAAMSVSSQLDGHEVEQCVILCSKLSRRSGLAMERRYRQGSIKVSYNQWIYQSIYIMYLMTDWPGGQIREKFKLLRACNDNTVSVT
jgi:hypothetical protein